MAPTRLAGSTFLVVLLLALLFPRLDLFHRILFIPLWTSTVLFIIAATTAVSLIQKDSLLHTIPWPARRRQHALRRLAFTTPSAWSAVLTRQTWETVPTGFAPIHRAASAGLNARLDSIFGLVRTTFILPWYGRISPSPAFPDAVEVLVRHILTDVFKRAEVVDWSTVTVSSILPLLKDHLRHYRTVEHLSSATLPLPLPAKAHPALQQQAQILAGTSSPSVEAHLRGWVRRMIGDSLPVNDRTEVVKTLVGEVLLGAVLLPTFELVCEGDFWNRQIDERGGKYLHEQ